MAEPDAGPHVGTEQLFWKLETIRAGLEKS
jgi:hypothetical protein